MSDDPRSFAAHHDRYTIAGLTREYLKKVTSDKLRVTKIKMSQRALTTGLLIVMFICSFFFRLLLLMRETLPPGPDVPQHATYVGLILRHGFPSWDPYHMGGEPIIRPLGFHYIAALISMIFDVSPIYAVFYTGVLFSALTPIAIFFFIRRLTGHDNLALVCAFLYNFSIFDIEMLSWGGYPNISGLALIPLTFYFLLGASKRSGIAAALLIFALSLIDHSSFFICMITIGAFAIFLLIKKGYKEALTFATPILIGVAISTPYLALHGIKIYLYTLITKLMPETYYDAFGVSSSTILLFMRRHAFFMPFLFLGPLSPPRGECRKFLLVWIGAPFILILCYFFGLYLNYERLVYFLGQPMMIFIAVGFYAFFTGEKRWLEKLSHKFKGFSINRDIAKVAFTLAIVAIVFAFQSQMFYYTSLEIADYYQIVRKGEYEALNWIITCTEEDDVLVSEQTFGWWVNGYAERPCLCFIPLKYINLPWQIQKSLDAYKILYLEEGYVDLINKYNVKYVVLRFNQVSGLPPEKEPLLVQLYRNNSDFNQVFNHTHIFIFEVNAHR